MTFGGGQERGLRRGTLPTHQIVGFGAACELAAAFLATEPARLGRLRDRLWQGLSRLEGVHLNGEAAPRLPGILNVSFEGVEGESLVTALDSLAVTTGSACSSASGDPSYVLRALGRGTQLAQSSLRFSFGRATTEADIDAGDRRRSASGDAASSRSPAGSVRIARWLGQVGVSADSHARWLRWRCARRSRTLDSAGMLRAAAPAQGRVRPWRPTCRLSRGNREATGLSALAHARYFDALPGRGRGGPAPGRRSGHRRRPGARSRGCASICEWKGPL